MNQAELPRRTQIRQMARGFAENGVTTSSPDTRLMITEESPFQIYQAGELERFACISLLMDPVIDRVFMNENFLKSVEAKELTKVLPTRIAIFALLHLKVSQELVSSSETYIDELATTEDGDFSSKELQAYKRLQHWKKFLDEKLSPQDYSPLDQGPKTALQAGFVTSIAMSTGIMNAAYELSKQNGDPSVYNPDEIANTFRNSFSTLLRIAAFDREVVLQNNDIISTAEFLESSNYQLESIENGFRVTLKKEFEEKLKSSPNLTEEQLEDPKGCPALAAPNGIMPAKRIFSMLQPIATDIYAYLFTPLTPEEEDMQEMERMLKSIEINPL